MYNYIDIISSFTIISRIATSNYKPAFCHMFDASTQLLRYLSAQQGTERRSDNQTPRCPFGAEEL